jgi:HEPN domain-containing protein
MNDDAAIWLRYAEDNLQAADMLLAAGLLNPALQNVQQAVEKGLKSLHLSHGMGVRRTHSIRELTRLLREQEKSAPLTDDDCDLFDSIYIGSKYPGDSSFAGFPADAAVAVRCIGLASQEIGRAHV